MYGTRTLAGPGVGNLPLVNRCIRTVRVPGLHLVKTENIPKTFRTHYSCEQCGIGT